MINNENEEAARKLRKLGERLRIALDPHYGKNVVVKLKDSASSKPPSGIRKYSSEENDRSRTSSPGIVKPAAERTKPSSPSVKKPTKK